MPRIYTLTLLVFISFSLDIYADNIYDEKKVFTLDTCLQLFEKGNRKNIIPSLEILKEQVKNDSVFDKVTYWRIVETLGVCYKNVYGLKHSIDLYKEAKLTFFEKSERKNVLWCLMRLMVFEKALSNYNQALICGYEALRLCAEEGYNGPLYVAFCIEIASVWENNESNLLAKLYIDEGAAVYADSGGGKDGFYPQVLYQKAVTAMLWGDLENAENWFQEALKVSKDNSKTYDNILNDYALFLLKQNRWKESLELFKKVNCRNDVDDDQSALWLNILSCNYFLQDTNATKNALRQVKNLKEIDIANIIGQFPENLRENYYDENADNMLFFSNLCAFRFGDKEINELAYDLNISMRLMGRMANTMLTKKITIAENEIMHSLYIQVDSLRELLTYKRITFEQRQEITDVLRQKEETLLAYVPDLAEYILAKMPHFETIKKRLQKDEVSLLFVKADIASQCKDKDFHSRYIAYAVNSDSEYPILVDLCKVEDIEEYDEDVFNAEQISAFYALENARTLYNSLWKKLEPFVKNKKRVYYSTTESLSNINFEALVNEENQRLRDVYDLCYVSSPALIGSISPHLDLAACNTVALWGGINYDLSIREMQHASSQSEYFSGTDISDILALRGETERGAWGFLPGTLKEVNGLKGLLQPIGIKPWCYIGSKATEESVKQWSGNSPAILHFATHGFLISTPIESKQNTFTTGLTAYSEKNRYMLWSGLLLAGSNNKWQGKELPDNVEDGILTADEISRLDLSNTQLAVLSACETARGKIDPVEGIWGLQRAFKQAGVQTIVMSLWKIPDEPTQLLMQSFYTHLLAGMETRRALREAQNDLMRLGYSDPYYWASFVVLD